MEAAAPTLMATHSGLRGRPGKELSDEVVAETVGRFAALLRGREVPASMALARDERETSGRLGKLVSEVAVAQGLVVVDLGVVSTPAAKLCARNQGLGGTVVVTGSHLGPEWNGLKLAAAPGYWPVDVRELPDREGARAPGSAHRDPGAAAEHATAICEAVDAEAVRDAGLRVSGSGGAGASARAVLEGLGCLPGGDRPDVVVRLDADGDRLGLADERGEELDRELTLPLAAIARRARVVVVGADTSRAIEAVVGGPVHRVAPGELHLLEGLAAHDADLAGEGNGGVVVPEVGAARDGLAAAAAILELLATTGRPLSELAAEIPAPARRRTSIACDPEGARTGLEAVGERWGATAPDPETGLLVEQPGAWALVRSSATEPVVRVTTEARDGAEADALHAELVDCLEAAVGGR